MFKNGIIIAHPKEELIGNDTKEQQNFWKKVSGKNTGVDRCSIDGKDIILSFITHMYTGCLIINRTLQSYLAYKENSFSLFVVNINHI